ncbi:MAG: homoserine dehydrogenase [Candidatus Auribacterota bacterium]|jgi:homoserine dehydrogenase|nr:homoserine dehydrogenase [Candidatus Auribacterota bacterium]
MEKTITLALLGFGTIGTGVVKTLKQNKQLLEKRIGANLSLKWIADLDIVRDRGVEVDPSTLITDGMRIVNDPEVDIVIELAGGCTFAREFILQALKNGKSVVTANKALLAEHGREIFNAEQESSGLIGFEASVAGGIPVIKTQREGLVANNILSIYGIINGTANYILTKMSKEKISFDEALRDAQKLGYAEADPSFDVDGIDSAHKLLLLGSLAAETIFSMDQIYVEGIRHITERDIEYAAEFDYVIKLLAIYKKKNGMVQLRVHPTLLPCSNLLSSVMDSFNAISFRGDIVGTNMYYGRGAGEMPTASAVVADIIDIGRALVSGTLRNRNDFHNTADIPVVQNIDDIETRYYMRFSVIDQPGVLAQISGILGKNNISISDVYQKERRAGDAVPLIMITHRAREHDVRSALSEIANLDIIKADTVFIRMEE